jgi:hypothetical protein
MQNLGESIFFEKKYSGVKGVAVGSLGCLGSVGSLGCLGCLYKRG